MAGLDKHQLIVVRKFMDTVFVQMEAGDLDLDEGMAVMRTAIAKFEPGAHEHAMAFMKDVINAETQ